VKFLFLLIVILLVAFALWPRPDAPSIEETFIAPQLDTIQKAERIEEQYMDALERSEERIREDSGGGKPR
jgi:hypothetical protein